MLETIPLHYNYGAHKVHYTERRKHRSSFYRSPPDEEKYSIKEISTARSSVSTNISKLRSDKLPEHSITNAGARSTLTESNYRDTWNTTQTKGVHASLPTIVTSLMTIVIILRNLFSLRDARLSYYRCTVSYPLFPFSIIGQNGVGRVDSRHLAFDCVEE